MTSQNPAVKLRLTDLRRGTGNVTEDSYSRKPSHVKTSPNIITLTVKGDDWAEDLTKAVNVDLRMMNETGQPIFWIIGADTLISLYAKKNAR